jgi:TPR repeat protein
MQTFSTKREVAMQGLPKNRRTAMAYFLYAARSKTNNKSTNFIGNLFRFGQGVEMDKYKALEWFIQSGQDSVPVEELNDEGIYLLEKRCVYCYNELKSEIR